MLSRRVGRILSDAPHAICRRIRSVWSKMRLRLMTGVHLGAGVVLWDSPIVDVREGAEIWIDSHVTLNSDNHGYHLNMHSPVKLFADRPGAVIRIGEFTRIYGSCLHAYRSITVGRRCLIAGNCQIFDCSGHDVSFNDVENRMRTHGEPRPVTIEDCVWLGANCIVLPGVTIGRGSIIGAGSVVTRDIPPMVVAAGNPAKVVRAADETLPHAS